MAKQRRQATAKDSEGRKRGNNGSEIGRGARKMEEVSSALAVIPFYGGKRGPPPFAFTAT